MAVGPLDSKITTDAIAATATARGEPKFLPVDVSEAISKIHSAREALGQEADRAVGPPPAMGMPLAMAGAPDAGRMF